jgi:hypothetical protein
MSQLAPATVYDIYNQQVIPIYSSELAVGFAQSQSSFLLASVAPILLVSSPNTKIQLMMSQFFMLPWEAAAPYTVPPAMTKRMQMAEIGMDTRQMAIIEDIRVMLDPAKAVAIRTENVMYLAQSARMTLMRDLSASLVEMAKAQDLGLGISAAYNVPGDGYDPWYMLLRDGERFGFGHVGHEAVLQVMRDARAHLPPTTDRVYSILPRAGRMKLASLTTLVNAKEWTGYTGIQQGESILTLQGVPVTDANTALSPLASPNEIIIEMPDLRMNAHEPDFDPLAEIVSVGQFYISRSAHALRENRKYRGVPPIEIYSLVEDDHIPMNPESSVNATGVFATNAHGTVAIADRYSSEFKAFVASLGPANAPWDDSRFEQFYANQTGTSALDFPTTQSGSQHLFTVHDNNGNWTLPGYMGSISPQFFSPPWIKATAESLERALDKELAGVLGSSGLITKASQVLKAVFSLFREIEEDALTAEYVNALRDSIKPMTAGPLFKEERNLPLPIPPDDLRTRAGFATVAGLAALADVSAKDTRYRDAYAALRSLEHAIGRVAVCNELFQGSDPITEFITAVLSHRAPAFLKVDGGYVRVPLAFTRRMFEDVYVRKTLGDDSSILMADPSKNYAVPLLISGDVPAVDDIVELRPLGQFFKNTAELTLLAARREAMRTPVPGYAPGDAETAVSLGATEYVTHLDSVSRCWDLKIAAILKMYKPGDPGAAFALLYLHECLSAHSLISFAENGVQLPGDFMYIRPSMRWLMDGILFAMERAALTVVAKPFARSVFDIEKGLARLDVVMDRGFAPVTPRGLSFIPYAFFKRYLGGANARVVDLSDPYFDTQQWLENARTLVQGGAGDIDAPSVFVVWQPLTQAVSSTSIHIGPGANVPGKTVSPASHLSSRQDQMAIYLNRQQLSGYQWLDFRCKNLIDEATAIEDQRRYLESHISVTSNQSPFFVSALLTRGPWRDPETSRKHDGVGPLGQYDRQRRGCRSVLSEGVGAFPNAPHTDRIHK